MTDIDYEVAHGIAQIELAKAKAEIERLEALSQNNARSWDALVRERDELRDEIEQLTRDLKVSRQDNGAVIAQLQNDIREARAGIIPGLEEAIRVIEGMNTGRKMTDITERFDNMVGHIVGINDERDVVPLLLGLKDMWPQVRAEIERLQGR